jgi:ribosome biogenesis GTPase
VSRRKLSDRQQARVKQLQQRRVHKAEQHKNKLEQHAIQAADLGLEQEGLLITFYGVYADVEDAQHKLYRCYLRQNLGTVVAGDRVIWRASIKNKDEGVVVAVKPRQTLLTRPVAPGKVKAIAANVDQMCLVLAPQPRPAINMIDSYLVAAEINHLKAVIICNKNDLLAADVQQDVLALLNTYQQLHYPVVFVSAQQQTGLADLKQQLNNHTSIFVGQSGVGKSSLVAQLLPAEAVRVDLLSPVGDHGMHTTTAARLYHLPGGGDLIDSPGVRDFRLWDIAPEKIAEGFIEFGDYLGRCQFRDCKHRDEKNCALLQAVQDGAIAEARLKSYQRIIAALAQ